MALKESSNGPGGDPDRGKSRQNLVVLGLLAGLVVLGLWLFSTLRAYLKVEACVEAGYRNCMPIETDRPR
jgi:hypothetical protein